MSNRFWYNLTVSLFTFITLSACSTPKATRYIDLTTALSNKDDVTTQVQCACTAQCFRESNGVKSICGKIRSISSGSLEHVCGLAIKAAQNKCGFKFTDCKIYSKSPPSCEYR
ncbi:hypothetical protein MNBD_GAMMA22-921 [hydrothermal vent metagenome]|uniref:Lipoprotein n=1 Tax=hydrothermal vent metagenome TaxID=652676 RepID=A0A3B1B6V2_9ZZZZ